MSYIADIGYVASIFGIATLTLLVWSFWHGATRLIVAGILFVQWVLSISSQLILDVETPLNVYWTADGCSAVFLFLLFAKREFVEWWIFWIGVLFVGMMGAHTLYDGGLHAYYHYWLITPMFAVQILIVLVRLVRDVVENSHINNSHGGISGPGGLGS